MKKKILLGIYVFVCVIYIFTNISYGYIDPSAMTYVIQIISATVIAIGTTAGIVIYKIKNLFKRNKKKEKKLDLEEIMKKQ